jgi:threonine/homoserine/homoserine lactone efflux protein
MPGHEDGRAAKRSRSDTVVVVVSGAHLAGFALAAFVLIVIPGPSVLFLIGRALTLGRGPAMAGVVGNALGVYLVAILVAVGLGSIVQRSDLAYNVVKTVGGVYLVWLGIQAIRHRHDLVTGRSRWSAARRGLLVGISNPKALIIFGAVLPQFVDRSGGHVPEQMLLLALVAFGIALISDSLWVLAASGVHAWLSSSPRRIAAVGGAGGLAMIGVGIGVATTGRRGS